MAVTMYRVPLSQLSPFLCTECLYGDTGHKKWSWQQGPPTWLKTIKSKEEIGHCLPVTDNSGTNVGHCKFPLLITPCPQTCTQASGGGECVSHMHTHTHTFYSCWRHRRQVRRKERLGCSNTAGWSWIMILYKQMNWRQHLEFVFFNCCTH